MFFPKFLGNISGNFHPFLLDVDIVAPFGNFIPRGIFPLLTIDTEKHAFTECFTKLLLVRII